MTKDKEQMTNEFTNIKAQKKILFGFCHLGFGIFPNEVRK
jgi:hypothetical protein